MSGAPSAVTGYEMVTPVKPRAASEPGLRFIEALTWIFESPKWIMNILLVALFVNFIPILGQVVVTGYLFVCVERELAAPQFGYPDFDLNQFKNYVKRGFAPWLVSFVLSILGVMVAMTVYMPLLFTAIGFLNTRDELWMMIGGLLFGLAYLVYIAFLVIVSVAPIPLVFRVGMTQNWRDVLEIRWALSYLRKVLPELFVAVMVVSLAILPLSLMGLLICFVGTWLMAAMLHFTSFRLLGQLYQIFLARGGEPIPLPPLPAESKAAEKISSPFMTAPG